MYRASRFFVSPIDSPIDRSGPVGLNRLTGRIAEPGERRRHIVNAERFDAESKGLNLVAHGRSRGT
jgi:hypothetical protein